MEDNKIYVSEMEYSRLCRADGRLDALVDYIKTTEYVDEKVVKAIIGKDYFK